ncbi:hypothetical protein JOC78_002942 [Bacillus ectoiniformans]|nr:hypothetical protein [Bacillus ectoiniformans]
MFGKKQVKNFVRVAKEDKHRESYHHVSKSLSIASCVLIIAAISILTRMEEFLFQGYYPFSDTIPI